MELRRGFSLIELAVTVAIMGVLAAIVAQSLGSFQRRYQIISSYSSLSAMDRAAEMYQVDYQALPPDRVQGVYPTEFRSYIPRTTFMTPPPFTNALWDWNGSNATPWTTHGANFAVYISPRPTGLWEEFDRRCDDGNIATGKLRLLNSNRNYCLLRQ